MSQEKSASSRRWRRALSLRALMLLVLVAGAFLGWRARRASTQRAAVARIREAGGSVAYDYQPRLGTAAAAGAGPAVPDWLRRVAGDEPFQEVRGVTLNSTNAPRGEPADATVAAIAALDHLEDLHVVCPPLADDQLGRLGAMPALKVALLLDLKATGTGLAAIRAWPRLETLAVRFDREVPAAEVLPLVGGMRQVKRLNVAPLRDATPGDFRALAGLAGLEYLAVRPSPRDESCLEPLAGLRSLTGLNLLETRVTDAGMRRLALLGRMERFAVDGSAVTDDGLAAVARWPDIQELYLVGPTPGAAPIPSGAVTDRGLSHLTGLGRLDNLTLAGRFTDAGLATLGRCPKLDTLFMFGIQASATGDGLRALLAARSFRQLGLEGPGVGDDWTPALAGQARLEFLTLSGPRITDAALPPLAALPSLRRLALTRVPITDAGLMGLARAGSGVRNLYLRETDATPAGVAALRAARPACRVDYEPGPGPP